MTTSTQNQYDLAIVGGGIVGLATAMTLAKNSNLSIILIEAEKELAKHQTGNNSGVIHSGLYYKPGSLKAINCIDGRDDLYAFCEENDVAFERCGKVVVATSQDEITRLDVLEERGKANGLNVKRLNQEQLKDYEPHLAGIAGLWVPETGIVDYVGAAQTYGKLAQENGAVIQTNTKLLSVENLSNEIVLNTTQGDIHATQMINCAGLQTDRIAKLCGTDPECQIIPFRGEYYELVPEKHHLVKNLIYPVPDPRFPFLGVHFTRMVKGGIEAGPNAVLALKREGYTHFDVSLLDFAETLSYAGFWKLIAKHWKMGSMEMYRSLSKQAYVKTLQKLIPELESKDVYRAGAGVRAQALAKNGQLLDDFHIIQDAKFVHVLNAPSPAATSSLSIAKHISKLVLEA